MKKKKESKAGFLRRWHLPYPSFQYHHLRYKNPPEKGVYWYWFSLFIRNRDVKLFGTCISCGKPITVETCDAGHYIPAGSCGRDLLFSEENVNAECSRCNAWDEAHLFGYRKELDARYGNGAAAHLEALFEHAKKNVLKDWSKEEYEKKIRALPNYKNLV